MIGDVLLECELEPGGPRTLAGFENHAGRTMLDDGAEPLGRVLAGFGNDGASGYEGCRAGRVSARTCTARCCRATRGSPTGCSPRRSRTDWAATARARSRSRTSSRARRTRSQPSARDSRGGARSKATQSAPRYTAGSPGVQRCEEALDRRVQDDLVQLARRRRAGGRARRRRAR